MENFDASATLEEISASMTQLTQTGEGFHFTLNLPDGCALDIQGQPLVEQVAKTYEYMVSGNADCVAVRCDLLAVAARLWPWVESAFTEIQMTHLLMMEPNAEWRFVLVDDNRIYVQGRHTLIGFIWHPHHIE